AHLSGALIVLDRQNARQSKQFLIAQARGRLRRRRLIRICRRRRLRQCLNGFSCCNTGIANLSQAKTGFRSGDYIVVHILLQGQRVIEKSRRQLSPLDQNLADPFLLDQRHFKSGEDIAFVEKTGKDEQLSQSYCVSFGGSGMRWRFSSVWSGDRRQTGSQSNRVDSFLMIQHLVSQAHLNIECYFEQCLRKSFVEDQGAPKRKSCYLTLLNSLGRLVVADNFGLDEELTQFAG